MVLPIEGGYWMVTLVGGLRDYPPEDEAGFLEYARSLAQPDLYEAIKDAEPVTPIVTYKYSANRWRHYERMSRLPEGFIVMGDAVCSFNPVYAQGMSVAALEAKTLETCLREQRRRRPHHGLAGFTPHFQNALAKVVRTPWTSATTDTTDTADTNLIENTLDTDPRKTYRLADLQTFADTDFCYLTTRGRISGRPHTIEIWFALNGHTLYMLSGGRNEVDWVKNILRSPAVQVKIKETVFSGQARLVNDAEEDALARKLVAGKHIPRRSDDLTDWSRSVLPVAVDLIA
jgi:deazaflavin-dependent oxidoreductase (nitroreductase family)